VHSQWPDIDQGCKKQPSTASITFLESIGVVDGVDTIVVDNFQQFSKTIIVAVVTVLAGPLVTLEVIVHVVWILGRPF
jgi:hypothetical protein